VVIAQQASDERGQIEVLTMRSTAGIEVSDRMPDETTILTFRHLL
jgi:IS5 family transposase